MNIKVLDGFEKPGTRDFAFTRTNAGQSYAQQNKEPRDGGFSRVDFNGEAGSPPLQGFDRTATEIMNGYNGADDEDLRDWDFLVTMEHPEVMNGLPAMQGKAKRQERKEARKEAKQEKKIAKAQNKQETKAATMRPGKAKRKEKRAERQQQRTDKKNIRLAKKEEKVIKRQANRERRDLNAEARRERKAGRGERVKDIFANIGDSAKEVISNIVTRPDVMDLTASDMSLPGGAGDFLDRWRGMDMEDVLDERDEIAEDRMYDPSAEDAGANAKPPTNDAGDDSNMMLIGVAAFAALGIMMRKEKKGKKKKK